MGSRVVLPGDYRAANAPSGGALGCEPRAGPAPLGSPCVARFPGCHQQVVIGRDSELLCCALSGVRGAGFGDKGDL